jgi:membrane protease YdiL (CAAX protease family)
MLGLFVYKTKRIEVSLFIHIFSNFFKYTLPILIWGKGQAILALIVNCLELLLLAS